MKQYFNWLFKNILLRFMLFALFLFFSINIILIASDIFSFVSGKIVEYTYISFLAILVVRVIFEQKKDAKADIDHFKKITMHFAIINVISYLLFIIILYFILRNGPIDIYTRFNERIIIYDFVYLSFTKSRLLASVLDYITVVILLSGSNFIAYKWLSTFYNNKR